MNVSLLNSWSPIVYILLTSLYANTGRPPSIKLPYVPLHYNLSPLSRVSFSNYKIIIQGPCAFCHESFITIVRTFFKRLSGPKYYLIVLTVIFLISHREMLIES